MLATSRRDYSSEAAELDVRFFRDADDFAEQHPDVVVLASSILSTRAVLDGLPLQRLRRSTLIVDVLSVKVFPKQLLLARLPESMDILCTHPMFGPESGRGSWAGLRMQYERVRIASSRDSQRRVAAFLEVRATARVYARSPATPHTHDQGFVAAEAMADCAALPMLLGDPAVSHRDGAPLVQVFEKEGCRMVEMSCEEHDRQSANTQFITHTVGRLLGEMRVESTEIDTRGYESLLNLVENTANDSFDLYYGLFMYNQARSLRAPMS